MALVVEHLTKRFPGFSIEDVSFEIREGEYFSILGPVGAGKTLLLELIAGFYLPDSGRIMIGGRDVTLLPPERRNVGFVFQDYALFPHLTVEENVEFGLKVRGVPKSERKKMVDEMLDLFGLRELRDRLPTMLSGGEQQKTSLARALVLKPEILLLDEPLSALDVPTRDRMRSELRRIHDELDVTTVHVTHDRAEAFSLADRVAIMMGGRVVQVGTPEEVFRKPSDEAIARFVGFENIFVGEVRSCEAGMVTIDVNGFAVEAVTERTGRVLVCIRPEDIIVSREPLESSARNAFEGRIVDYLDLGPTVRLDIDAGLRFRALITKPSFVEMGLRRGSRVFVTFKATSVHVI